MFVLGIAPVLIEAAAVKRTAFAGLAAPVEQNLAERFLDGLFGESSDAIKATASPSTAYLRIASLSIAAYE